MPSAYKLPMSCLQSACNLPYPQFACPAFPLCDILFYAEYHVLDVAVQDTALANALLPAQLHKTAC